MVAGVLLLTGCPGGDEPPPPDLPAVGGQVALIRVPLSGGQVEAFHPDSLGAPIWTSRADLPRIREVLGVNADARLLMAVDTLGTLIAVDLEAGSVRQIGRGIDQAVLAPDGAILTVDSARRVSRYQAGLPTQYREGLAVAPAFHAGTLGNRYVAVLGTDPRQLVILGHDARLHESTVGPGQVAATFWGDLVAIAEPRGLRLYSTEDPFEERPVRTNPDPRYVTFSPSGHRLYVAHTDPSIEVIDRYSLERIATLRLPGPPTRLRTDGSGRWLLAQVPDVDSAWVVDLTTGRLAGTVKTDWTADLPTVAGAATLLASTGGDLVAVDLATAALPERGRIPGAAADYWVVTSWQPKDRQSLAAAAAQSALATQDSLLVTDSVAAGPADRLYLQVSHSQNSEWSRDFARRLTADGYPARVLDPAQPDDGYRVVVGPYPDRARAEEAGRRLDRPYFILTNPPISQ